MRSTLKLVTWALLATCVAPLSACTFLDSFVPDKGKTTDVIDRQKNMTINDFKDLGQIDKEIAAKSANQETTITGAVGAPPVPDIAQVLAAPRPPKVANSKLVTLAVTDDVPLRDVLFELGRLANVDIEVGPGLDRTGINLRATDRPFNEVIERLSELAALRYSVNGSSIRVERDLPYIKEYSIDFLNLVRSSTSNYSLSTSIGGGGGSSGGSSGGSAGGGESGGGGGGSSDGGVGNSSSGSNITSTAESDLWSSLEASVTEILNYSPILDTGADAATGAASGAASGSGGPRAGSLVINRQAGVLSVNGTKRQHEMVQNFLNLMTRNASAQVLIEAKIVEVALNDQFASGVDWNRVIGNLNNSVHLGVGRYLPSLPGSTASTLGTASTGNPALTFGIEQGDLGMVLALTQTFGTTRTLSSPRLSAINNQQAVLTFARNQVYFDCSYEPASTSTTSTSTTSSTEAALDCDQRTIPIGIIMTILPSINLDTQEVTLNVRPTLTRQVDTARSPVTGFLRSIAEDADAAALIPDITVPVIESREIDSITKVKTGGVMVIGGLMEDVSRNSETGVPGMGEIPIFGDLFKSRSEDGNKRELIIFIKATIINSDGSAHKVDRAVYDKFLTDPRPLFPKQ